MGMGRTARELAVEPERGRSWQRALARRWPLSTREASRPRPGRPCLTQTGAGRDCSGFVLPKLVGAPGEGSSARTVPEGRRPLSRAALSKPVLCERPLRFPEPTGCPLLSPVSCSEVGTAVRHWFPGIDDIRGLGCWHGVKFGMTGDLSFQA